MATTQASVDLIIRGEAIQRVYQNFVEGRYLVNRRYQRKLVWTVDEKVAFIDSLIRGYPVPLILLAETEYRDQRRFEIIDGMQRLDAVTSFVEQAFAVDGNYFDLQTMAQTKQRLDSGELTQKTPLMDRETCVTLANYQLPFSTYPGGRTAEGKRRVDEIFRRINSFGRHLSRQELRQVGALGNFAELVRQMACWARGDVSATDLLLLDRMREISISSKQLDYGIDIDTIFWVREGVLSRRDVRESRDEELVADILAYMALGAVPGSHTKVLDDYFGHRGDWGGKGTESDRYAQIERAVQAKNPDVLADEFKLVFEEVRQVCASSERRLAPLLTGNNNPVPRYFQSLFLAFHSLLIDREMVVSDRKRVAASLEGLKNHFNVKGGSWWAAKDRERSVGIVRGLVDSHFRQRTGEDAALASWVVQLENLLNQSLTEQSLYDFKQGLYTLGHTPQFDDDCFNSVVKTLTAIANNGPGNVGYVLVGICDQAHTAARVKTVHGVEPMTHGRFWITGIEHEALLKSDKGLDVYYQWVLQKLEAQPIPPWAAAQLARDSRLVKYFDKAVLVFTIRAPDEPISYDRSFYERAGPNTRVVPTSEYRGLFARFPSNS